MLANLFDGRIKMWTTMRTLRFRREHNEIFRRGTYAPLFASGSLREHVVSFARQFDHQMIIVAVPRFTYTLLKGAQRPALGAEVWQDAYIQLQSDSRQFRNVLTDENVYLEEGQLLCREAFARFPIALLASI